MKIIQGKSITEWAKHFGISAPCMRVRLQRGWAIEDCGKKRNLCNYSIKKCKNCGRKCYSKTLYCCYECAFDRIYKTSISDIEFLRGDKV